jgi:hypothetical protein
VATGCCELSALEEVAADGSTKCEMESGVGGEGAADEGVGLGLGRGELPPVEANDKGEPLGGEGVLPGKEVVDNSEGKEDDVAAAAAVRGEGAGGFGAVDLKSLNRSSSEGTIGRFCAGRKGTAQGESASDSAGENTAVPPVGRAAPA